MSGKRKDSKGRSLRNGETQMPDGRYRFQYTDNDGHRKVYLSHIYNRLGSLFTVLLGTGLRIGEALALMEVYAKATRDKKLEAIREMNGKLKVS